MAYTSLDGRESEEEEMTKAYMVWVDDSDKGCGIVFAENHNQARQKAQFTDACEDERYIDIRAKRMPDLDRFSEASPQDNLWLNDDVRMILVKDHSWYCIERQEEECANCTAREYCDVYGRKRK